MNSKMIAAFIREKRETAKLSQTELAEIANVSRRSIFAIEGEESVRKSTLEKVANALGYELVISYDFIKKEKNGE